MQPAAASAVRYPPDGERLCQARSTRRYAGTFRCAGISIARTMEVLAIGAIEHFGTLETIGEVVATPGLDLAFIGPGEPRYKHGAQR